VVPCLGWVGLGSVGLSQASRARGGSQRRAVCSIHAAVCSVCPGVGATCCCNQALTKVNGDPPQSLMSVRPDRCSGRSTRALREGVTATPCAGRVTKCARQN
jgi:hypothetical protein